MESVTFFKASVRLKTRAVEPLIIYSQKIPCEEHIFKEKLAENKTATCEYFVAAYYTYHINGLLLSKEITPWRVFFSYPSHFLFVLFFWHNPVSSCLQWH